MIIDRTISDVENAILIIRDKLQKGISLGELSENDIATLERGTLTINTLNRIEQSQEELKNLLNDMGYWNNTIINKSWTYSDFFTKEDFDRIIQNNVVLIDSFFAFADTPSKTLPLYNYKELNNLEKVLVDVEEMISDVKSRYRQSGTFKSGEANAQ